MSPPIHDNLLSLIGQTPLVRLDKLAAEEGLKCNLLAKCEWFNAGGSVKDRIALRMVEEAEKEGRIKPGYTTLIEASSGNTGIGLALVSAIKGYKCIITMPEKMSLEKENTIKALGATIIRTPTEAAHDSEESNIGLAMKLVKEMNEEEGKTSGEKEEVNGSGSGSGLKKAVMLDQYSNKNNPDAHYYGTASEIVSSLSSSSSPSPSSSQPNRLSSSLCDLFIAGAGTGGTITGISRRLRESNPNVVILGVDPVGSILARPESLNELKEGEEEFYRVEGIGYDFVPETLSHSTVDLWLKTSDSSSFSASRRLMRTEGMLCGGSCGAAVAATLEYLKSPEGAKKFGQVEGKNVVVLLADSIRNYVTSAWLSETDETPVKP